MIDFYTIIIHRREQEDFILRSTGHFVAPFRTSVCFGMNLRGHASANGGGTYGRPCRLMRLPRGPELVAKQLAALGTTPLPPSARSGAKERNYYCYANGQWYA